jgi:hypothetical protein
MMDTNAVNRIRAIKGLPPIGTKDDSHLKRERDKKEKKAKKKKKPINPITDKRKEINKELKKLVPVILRRDPICKIQSPVCTRVSTVVNHTEGRGLDVILDADKMEGCCAPCNGYIESHPTFNGGKHKKPRHNKKQ